MTINWARVCVLMLCALVFPSWSSCHRQVYAELEEIDPIDRRSNLQMVAPINRDLADIKKRGTLIVLAPYNATTYFIYRGEPLGYEYELLQSFAKAQLKRGAKPADVETAVRRLVASSPDLQTA